VAVKKSEATWNGTLKEGSGNMRLGSQAVDLPFTFASRFADEHKTNPEELIGAAHAGCFSMFLSAQLTAAGFPPTTVHTTATVHLTDGPTISTIELICDAKVPGIDQAKFDELVDTSKKGCPVSKALAAVPEIKLTATLTS
jgi:osmotically inducible protein OsmC